MRENRLLSGLLRIVTATVYLYLLAPVVVVVAVAFNPLAQTDFPITGFTLHWFSTLLRDDAIMRSLLVSLVLGLSAATIATLIGAAGAYALARLNNGVSEGIQLVLLLPMLIPHLILGIGLLIVWRFLGLPRNFLLLLAGHVVVILPLVVLVTRHRFASVSPHLVEAARTLGANGLQAFRAITLPLMFPAFAMAFLYAFMSSFDELTATLFWLPANTQTVTTQVLALLQFSTDHRVNALATLLIAISVGLPALVFAVSRGMIHLGRRAKRRRPARSAGMPDGLRQDESLDALS